MSDIPNLTGKSGIQLTKKLSYILACPKCEGDIDVTEVKTNAHIECSHCKNVTWRPDYNPPWWAKTRNFIFSLFLALIIGIISTWIVNLIFSENNVDKKNPVENSINDINK